MSRRKRPPVPDPFAPDLVLSDKRRGVLLGLAVGEMLGKPVDGLDRDAILRAHGRVVRPLDGPPERPLTTLARALHARDHDVEPLTLVRHLDPADPARLVLAPFVGIRPMGTDARGTALAARAIAKTAGGDEPTVEASALIAVVAAIAINTEPFDVLLARSVVDALRSVASTTTEGSIDELARLVRTPMRPSSYLRALAPTPPPIEIALFTVLSLLVRPRSLRESIVFAVNLGGACSVRGAITGAIAGAHRGASCVPTAWLAAVYHGQDDRPTSS